MTNRYAKPNRYTPAGVVSCPTCEQKARAYIEPAHVRPEVVRAFPDSVRYEVVRALVRASNLAELITNGEPLALDRWGNVLTVDDHELIEDATRAELLAAVFQLDAEVEKELARRDWLAGYVENLAGGEA